MPASDDVAGPRVQTIFARRVMVSSLDRVGLASLRSSWSVLRDRRAAVLGARQCSYDAQAGLGGPRRV